jgi:hypothetical protein
MWLGQQGSLPEEAIFEYDLIDKEISPGGEIR